MDQIEAKFRKVAAALLSGATVTARDGLAILRWFLSLTPFDQQACLTVLESGDLARAAASAMVATPPTNARPVAVTVGGNPAVLQGKGMMRAQLRQQLIACLRDGASNAGVSLSNEKAEAAADALVDSPANDPDGARAVLAKLLGDM